MELVENGSLDKVLRQRAGQVGVKVKLAMCAQICQAMCQLAKENVVHRDLAARNVLVQSLNPPCVKVSMPLTADDNSADPFPVCSLHLETMVLLDYLAIGHVILADLLQPVRGMDTEFP